MADPSVLRLLGGFNRLDSLGVQVLDGVCDPFDVLIKMNIMEIWGKEKGPISPGGSSEPPLPELPHLLNRGDHVGQNRRAAGPRNVIEIWHAMDKEADVINRALR